jgi:hypothetical protein
MVVPRSRRLYQRRMAGQDRAQGDALLLAAAVLQRDIEVHIARVPPSQVRSERRQRLDHVLTFLRHEAGAYVDRILTKSTSLLTVIFRHRGPSPLNSWPAERAVIPLTAAGR